MGCEEDGDLGTEDDASDSEESEGELLTSPARTSCRTSTRTREEIAHSQRC